MTRREVVASSPEDMRKRYRKVSRTCGGPDALLEECAADAVAINAGLARQKP